MNSNTIFLILLLSSIIQQTTLAQKAWTYEDRRNYAERNLDTTNWDMKMLQGDIESFLERDWPTKSGISSYPSPVADYDWGYGYISPLELIIGDLTIKGNSVGFAKGQYRSHLLKDSTDYYINYFNIFILSDRNESEAASNHMLSRNYPHYMSTGSRKTSMGKIDWLQMNLADGSNFAVVSQRYFDLEFGKTILVMPLKDGSLRLLQIKEDFGSFVWDDLGTSESPKDAFVKRLAANPKVRSFFLRQDALK